MAVISLLPTENIYVAEWYPDVNFYQRDMLYVSQYQQVGDDYRSLIQFSLHHIPPTSTIIKAELELFMYRNEVQDNIQLTAHRILDRWSEETVTWDSQPLCPEEPESSISVYSDTPLGFLFIDVTALVQGWYDGSIPNNGILLKGDEEQNSLLAFSSHYFWDSREWPRLKVTFVEGILNVYDKEELKVPRLPDVPIVASCPIAFGPRKQATFLVENISDSPDVRARLQVGYEDSDEAVYFDDGSWVELKRNRYPGEAKALSSSAAAEYARVLIKGCGGEKVAVYARTREG